MYCIALQEGHIKNADGNPATYYLAKNITRRQWSIQTTFDTQYLQNEELGWTNVKMTGKQMLILMKEKMNRFENLLESNISNISCTALIIHNLLEVYFLQIPCNGKILEEATVFCMHKSENYYETPLDFRNQTNRGLMQSYQQNNHLVIINPFICEDGTVISAYHVCDGMADCYKSEDENFCNNQTNLFYPSYLCSYISAANLTLSFESMIQ